MSSRGLVLMLLVGCRAAPAPTQRSSNPAPIVFPGEVRCLLPPAPVEVAVRNDAEVLKDQAPWAAVVLDPGEWMKLSGNLDRYRLWVSLVRAACEPPDDTGADE